MNQVIWLCCTIITLYNSNLSVLLCAWFFCFAFWICCYRSFSTLILFCFYFDLNWLLFIQMLWIFELIFEILIEQSYNRSLWLDNIDLTLLLGWTFHLIIVEITLRVRRLDDIHKIMVLLLWVTWCRILTSFRILYLEKVELTVSCCMLCPNCLMKNLKDFVCVFIVIFRSIQCLLWLCLVSIQPITLER